MRLHTLTLEAFGPFPGRERIDFDALDQGILLINGPTGSGKSSLLDAVAFALFGDVPGARRSLRQSLRSHHAAPDAQPRVELEFSVGPARWRVERSPQWEAPKRRGTGTTTRQASVLLSQWRDGAWHLVSQRIDEAADMMTDTLGMRLEQFAQVVLLPQGEFAQFLRAKPEDRRILLERLFDVSRFDAVERWFTETKNERAREREAQGDRIDSLVTLVGGTLTRLAAEDDEFTAPDLTVDDEVAALPERLSTVAHDVARRSDALEARAQALSAQAERAARTLEDEAERARLRERTQEATAILEQWTPDRLATVRRTLDDAAEVAGALRLHEHATAAAAAAEQAATRLTTAENVMRQHGVDVPDDVWPPAALAPERLEQTHESLRKAEAAAHDVETAAERAHRLLTRRDDARAQHMEADERAESTAITLAQAVGEHDRGVGLSGLVPDPATARGIRDRLVAGASRRPAACAALRACEQESEAASRAYADAEAAVLALRAARLAGIAGELGASLRPGDACPVCGSCEHPAPASLADDAPAPEHIEAAEAQAATANGHRIDAAAAVSAAAERLTQLDASLAANHVELVEALDAIVRDVAAARDADQGGELEHLGDAESLTLRFADADAVATWAPGDDTRDDAAVALTQVLDRLASTRDELQARSARLAEAATAARDAHAKAVTAAAAARERLENADASLVEARETLSTAITRLAGAVADVPTPTLRALGLAWPLPADASTASEATVVDAGVGLERADADDVGVPAVELTQLLTQVAQRKRLIDDLERRRGEAEHADAVARDADRAVHDELAAAGHTRIEDARALALPDSERTRLDAEWNDAVRRRAAAEAVVDDERARIAASIPAADPARLRRRADDMARQAREAGERAARWRHARTLVESVREQLDEAVRTYVPLAERAEEMAQLAASFTGTGENTHRMRLTSYVLAAHLETVTQMANERLATMTDGRYQLRHTDERAKGTQRSGLGLSVVDAWTGRSRDTATLSGGEAFMASLALALGLGDAVRADSGGLELNTLFVDEGFGSLDQDTLEQVMEVLDSLREGGRLVGVVSHVSELRARIPTRVEVIKTSEGSSVRTTPSVPNAVSVVE